MIRIGILTVRQEKAGFWKKLHSPVRYKEEFVTQAEIKVAELAWTAEELLRLPLGFRRLIFGRGKRFLSRLHCDGIAPDKIVAQAFSFDGEEEGGIILPISAQAMERCVFAFREPIKGKKVCLRTRTLTEMDESIIHTLCPWVDSLVICTGEKAKAQELADQICNDFGFYPQVRGYDAILTAPILIDLETGILKIGDKNPIDGMEVFLDLQEYQVNQRQFFQGLAIGWEDSPAAFWMQGKKRLTRR